MYTKEDLELQEQMAKERGEAIKQKDENIYNLNGEKGVDGRLWLVKHTGKNRAQRRAETKKDDAGRILNNRGNAGQEVLHKMAYFGMKVADYRFRHATTRYSKFPIGMKGRPTITISIDALERQKAQQEKDNKRA